jgi:hypothetical protein
MCDIVFKNSFLMESRNLFRPSAIRKPSSQRYRKESEIIPKYDVPDDVGRPKYVAGLSKKRVLFIHRLMH